MSLSGKVVIITGASSGIGAAVAESFAKVGSKIAIVGRNAPNLKATEMACKAANKNVQVLSIIADVTVDAERIIKTTLDKFSRLDVLVNNAGAATRGNILDTNVEEFDWTLNVNLRSVFVLTKLAAPHLIKTQGNIVNVSSLCGLRSFPDLSNYCVAKAGLDQLTRCIALDLADKKVRVNAVNPGVIETEFQKRSGLTEEQYVKFKEHSKSTHALGRVGAPKEVADAIIFLAGDTASFITGVTLPIDGGRQLICPR